MLTKFKLFENRITYGTNFYETKGYIKEISRDDLTKYVPENFDFEGTNPIFRGFGELKEGYYLINPDVAERESANTTNYYNTLIQNLPSWKKYPKRKLICSVNKSVVEDQYAHNESETAFRLIPLDENSLIGVCPTPDVWSSFEYASKAFTFNDTSWEATFLNDVLQVCGLKSDYNDIVNNFEEKLTKISKFDYRDNNYLNKPHMKGYIDRHFDNDTEYYVQDAFLQHMDIDKLLKSIKNKGGSLRFLDDAFNPEKNGFKKYKFKDYAKLNLYQNGVLHLFFDYNEVWLDSKCVILRTDLD